MYATVAQRRVFLYALVFLSIFLPCSVAGPRDLSNPYRVLGVSKDASSDEIRRAYRKLCLKLHPDKNVDKSQRERQKCEDLFKKVQQANALIGDEEARRNYDRESSYPAGFGSSPFGATSTSHRSSGSDAFFRAYYGQQQRYATQRTPFYFNGVDISDMFSTGKFPGPGLWGPTSLKSIYVQKVEVPLQDLYAGSQGSEFVLKENAWKRYAAAFRGGVALSVLYQAAIFSLPILRMSATAMALFGSIMFHANLPRPTRLNYDVNIQRGWKGGTKLTFQDVEPGFDVVFILEEGKHKRFSRVGDDLHTTIEIEKSQAKNGCSARIKSLNEQEEPIEVRLLPNEIKYSGQQVTVKGKGWPRRKAGGLCGDLVVTVNIVPDRKARRKRPSGKNKKKKR